jgi:putative YjhG/YagF family dehydratase
MPSLSAYDKGKRSFEGRRYWKDVEAAKGAREIFANELAKCRGYKPELISTEGNHENRIDRATDDQPALDGQYTVFGRVVSGMEHVDRIKQGDRAQIRRSVSLLSDQQLWHRANSHSNSVANLLLHLPAIAFSAGLRRPTVADWIEINRKVSRIVDVLPNGPKFFKTVQVFLAGGVPEVMLHLRRAGLLETDALTASGENLGDMLDWWEQSERRVALRKVLRERDGVDPDDVIMDPDRARSRGLTSTVTFPVGNLAPGGSVIKSTAIDPSVVDADGIYRKRGRARVFRSETDAVAAIKGGRIQAGDVLVLMCRGPMGSGMEEIYQITSALKFLPFGKHVAVLTDARFSGVSTGACIGHVTPEALAGGPLGKILEGDDIEITIDRGKLEGAVNFIVNGSVEEGSRVLAARPQRDDLQPDPALPAASRLWAALQDVSGGTWGGCVFDADAIMRKLR